MAGTQDFEIVTFPSSDGLRLYARDYAPREHQNRLPVICLAGLSRNSRDFHLIARHLSSHESRSRRVITLDTRGRGQSERDPDPSRYTVAHEAGDVLDLCRHLGIERAIFIGTSRGGLILHLLAATHPERMAGVVLNDIGPVIEIDGLLDIRDYLRRPAARFSTWDEVIAAVKATHGASFPALDEADWADLARAIHREDGGAIVPDHDPAITAPLAALTPETQLPALWPQFAAFEPLPMLVIRGEFSRLLSPQTVDAMASRHPDMTVRVAKGQGHAPLLHRPDTAEAIDAFLARLA